MSDIDQSYIEPETDDPARYAEARTCSYVLTALGVGILAWVVFGSYAQEAAIWTAMAYPIAVLIVAERYAGIMKFNSTKRDPHPSFGTALMFSVIGLFFKASQQWHVVEWHNFWPPFAIAFLTMAAASYALSSEIRKSVSAMFMCSVFCGFYGYGAVLDVNGMLATAPPTTCQAQINDMYIVRGKSTTYHFILSAWGSRDNGNKVDVSSYEYTQHRIGDTVTITVRVGYLGIPNFWVR